MKKRFYLGEDWLYFKIYTGEKYSDEIIYLINELFEQELYKYIEGWFFIRYQDPDYHLRVRFKMINLNYFSEVFQILNNCFSGLLNEKIIWDISYHTYNRELDRYGVNSIEYSEKVFCNESILISKILKKISMTEDKDDYRWLYGLYFIDLILDFFEISFESKIVICREIKESFEKEFLIEKLQRKVLNLNYREDKDKIFSFFQKEKFEESIINDLELFKINTENLYKQILINNKNINKKELIFSHIHMALNRLFMEKNRLNEFICYFYLEKYYNNLKGIKKYSSLLYPPL